jgi:hypothetical protein
MSSSVPTPKRRLLLKLRAFLAALELPLGPNGDK